MPMLRAEIAEPNGEAVQQDEIHSRRMKPDCIGDIEWLFNGKPTRRTLAAVTRDSSPHLIVFEPGRGNVGDPSPLRTQGLRAAALTAPSAADDERKHERGTAPPFQGCLHSRSRTN